MAASPRRNRVRPVLSAARRASVERGDAYVHAHLDDDVTLSKLCRVVVSLRERGLRNALHGVLGKPEALHPGRPAPTGARHVERLTLATGFCSAASERHMSSRGWDGFARSTRHSSERRRPRRREPPTRQLAGKEGHRATPLGCPLALAHHRLSASRQFCDRVAPSRFPLSHCPPPAGLTSSASAESSMNGGSVLTPTARSVARHSPSVLTHAVGAF